MIFKYLKRILFWLASSLITIILLILIGLNLLPLAEPYLQQHRSFFETAAKNILQQPVAIGTIKASYKGILPEFQFQDVKILNDAGNETLSKIKSLKIDIDPVQSLKDMRFRVKMLVISGAHLSLYQGPDGQISLAKRENVEPCQVGHSSGSVTLADILEFIFTQEKVQLKDITLDWFANKKPGIRIGINSLLLKPGSEFKRAEVLTKEFNLQHAFPGTLSFDLQWSLDGLSFKPLSNKLPLIGWLNQAFANENNVSGSVHIYGLELNSDGCAPQKIFFAMRLKGLNLTYFPGWPPLRDLEGDLLIRDGALYMIAHSGTINNVPFKFVKAEIPNLSEPILTVEGQIGAAMQNGLDFIKASPLNDLIGDRFKDLIIKGPLNLALKLEFNLSDKKAAFKVDGRINLQKNSLYASDWDLNIKELNGGIKFTKDAITAEKITGDLFGQKALFSLKTLNPETKQSSLEADIKGEMPSKLLLDKTAPELSEYIKGNFNYNAVLKLLNDKNDPAENSLLVTSDLLGIAIELPEPLKKTASQKKPSRLMFKFKGKEKKQFTLDYDKGLTAALSHKTLEAKISVFKWQDWEHIFSKFAPKFEAGQKAGIGLEKIILDFSRLEIFNQILQSAKIAVFPKPDSKKLQLDITSPDILGSLNLSYAKENQYIRGEFPKLHLQAGKDSTQASESDPSDVYPFTIKSTDFKYNEMSLGTLELKSSRIANGLDIDLNLRSGFFALNAKGRWQKLNNAQHSSLQGELNAADLGKLLKSWDLGENLLGGHGKAVFDLSWRKPFFDPDLRILSGNLDLRFNEGRIINLGRQAEKDLGIGRFLNLFSLQSIPRRLTLDFKDVTSKGFGFNKIRGNWRFAGGNVFTENMSLEGDIAYVQIKGRIGLVNKDYDLKLYTVPLVTGSLPVVAVVAAQPVVGAAVWVFDQLLRRGVKNVSKPTYSITGSWANPKIVKL